MPESKPSAVQGESRRRISRHTRMPEPQAVARLLPARPQPATAEAARKLAQGLVENLRRQRRQASGVDALMHEFSLSSEEGVALMCLAEALLRIPDSATRDRLIADKIGRADWKRHIGNSPSLFVNAAAWGLLLTGKLVGTHSEQGMSANLSRLLARGGEPVVRAAVDYAMRLLGRQFVCGQTIVEALRESQPQVARGFRYSYDMLGEAALTADDADRYCAAYEEAIHAIGQAAQGAGPKAGPGISVKLSALHPRYSRSQHKRVMEELLPRLRQLAQLAMRYDIGINIDAEEADRLELSLDLFEALALDPSLKDFNGLGFVVQAYQKRCPDVITWLAELAQRSGHRFMIRLVKGAYWDSEIKRAQVDGLEDYPVYTRKPHTDASWLACARQLLARGDVFYPQFATHNALSMATVHHWALEMGVQDFEFQCLHGMGEGLYKQVVGAQGLQRNCRIYAPVGPHQTLLAYLVRRLLENGANSSFVNQLVDERIALDVLLADPFVAALASGGQPHPAIVLPEQLYGSRRRNSPGLDLASELVLEELDAQVQAWSGKRWQAFPMSGKAHNGEPALSINPADSRDAVASVMQADAALVKKAVATASQAQPAWQALGAQKRADILCRAADLMQQAMPELLVLIAREAGRTLPAAVGEVREAIDFLRYYADQARQLDDCQPLGVVACISPWNFPLAIFTGQIAAALAAGNAVLAKPAEQTPAVGARAVEILHAAGVPPECLHFLPGEGATVGAAMVAHPQVDGVMFTGSTAVGAQLQSALLQRTVQEGRCLPLIAETGGLNAMLVDSSALPEQVVQDALSSAFDSAGQRCSALRLLCLQEEAADAILNMLHGALRQWQIGLPLHLSSDVGPVIDDEARAMLQAHVETLRARGCEVWQLPLPADLPPGSWFPPTVIQIERAQDLEREVFGPVLHVLRYKRAELPALLDQIAASGYGLTQAIHSRIDETIAAVVARAQVGNLYVNRNMIGAVVGVQPFGGMGKSGTGPKAGGPHYLWRLVKDAPDKAMTATDMPGPTGESNRLQARARGRVLCLAEDAALLARMQEHVRASGNEVVEGVDDEAGPPAVSLILADLSSLPDLATRRFADGAPLVLPVIDDRLPPLWMMHAEQVLTTNTAAVGGNASLMNL